MIDGLMTYCLNCNNKIPCSDLYMVKWIIEQPCSYCGAMKVVDKIGFQQFKTLSAIDYDKLEMDKMNFTTYSTTTDMLSAFDKDAMKKALEYLKPLSREFKRTELKIEFLKNRWSW